MSSYFAATSSLAIPVALTRGNASFDHCATMREHDLGAEVIVTHFRSDLSIAVVGVDEIRNDKRTNHVPCVHTPLEGLDLGKIPCVFGLEVSVLVRGFPSAFLA